MKKVIIAMILISVFAVNIFGQQMVNPRTFATYYGFTGGVVTPNTDNEYYWSVDYDDHTRFGAYEGEEYAIDTAKEWFLAMACGTSQIKVTDVSMANRIEAVLPSNDAKIRGLQAGAVVYGDLVIARFLGNTSAFSRHETVLQWIISRGNVTRAEVETFYRNGIRGFIAEIVNEEFNKISFLLRTNIVYTRGTDRFGISYGGTLVRNHENGQYILNCEGWFYEDYIRTNGRVEGTPRQSKTFVGSSLDVLLNEMRRNTADIDQSAINFVRTQAALIPAIASASVRDELVFCKIQIS